MNVKKFTSFCQALKRCTQKKIGSIGLYDNLFLSVSCRPTNTLGHDSAQILHCFTHLKYCSCNRRVTI